MNIVDKLKKEIPYLYNNFILKSYKERPNSRIMFSVIIKSFEEYILLYNILKTYKIFDINCLEFYLGLNGTNSDKYKYLSIDFEVYRSGTIKVNYDDLEPFITCLDYKLFKLYLLMQYNKLRFVV